MLAAILVLTAQLERLSAPANLDFEEIDSNGRPVHWFVLPENPEDFDFDVTTTDQDPATGARSVVIRRYPGKHDAKAAASLTQLIEAPVYRGHRVRLQAWAKRRGRTGEAILRMRLTRRGAPPLEHRVTLTNSRTWKRYELTVDVPADADAIEIGMRMTGEGETSLDAMSFEIVDGRE